MPSTFTSFANSGITITSGPTILIADPINKVFQFTYAVKYNGKPRVLLDKYYK